MKHTNENITIYEPNQKSKIGFLKIWSLMIKNIVSSKELIWQLFKRDFFMAYKKSYLGIAWIFISPLIGIISWILMNAAGILNPGNVGMPYAAYVLIGTSIWGLFMGFYTASSETLNAGAGMIMQVKYPHEALLVKQIAQHLASFLLSFGISLVFLFFFVGVNPSWLIIFLPLIVFPLLLLSVGIGLIISVIGVVAVDIKRAMDILLGFVLYLTPVIYSDKVQNTYLQCIIDYNPLTYLIGTTRDIIVTGEIAHPQAYLYSSAFSLLFFIISWKLFFISEEKVIEKLI